jgi:hypothetical protein
MSDFLTVTADTAAVEPESTGGQKYQKTPPDPRFWKPTIKNAAKEYQAMVRMLPRGLNGLKNKLNPSVKILTHRLKSEQAKVFMNVKCRKMLGEDQFCPICDAGWAIFNEGKAQNNKEIKDQGKDILAKESHIMNILIRNDIQVTDLIGQVKLWEHTGKMNKTLFEPTKEEKRDPSKPASIKKKQIFYPYSPKNGRDFLVMVTEDPEKHMASYDNSEWDTDGFSDLAGSDAEIMAILDKCYDLTEFLTVPSAEEAAQKYAEFCAKVEQKLAGRAASGSMPGTGTATGAGKVATKNVKTGDAQNYFGGASVQTPSASASPAPSAEPEVEFESENSAADDELPF